MANLARLVGYWASILYEVKLADSKTVLKYSLALMLAVRCQNKEACLQIMGKLYSTMDEQQLKTMMLRLIYLLTPTERDWLKSLA